MILAILVSSGCGHASLTGPSGEREQYIVDETKRYSDKLGRYVRGYVTDTRATYGCDDPKLTAPQREACFDAGWLEGAKAFYYRPWVNDEAHVSMQLLSDVAAHEVCHTLSCFHDQLHWQCIVKLGANPTYPEPTAGHPDPTGGIEVVRHGEVDLEGND